MSQGRIDKQPDEKLNWPHSFAGELNAEDTITLISVTAIDLKTALDSTTEVIQRSPAPEVDGQTVEFQVIGGNNGDHHKITILVDVSTGEELEADIDLYVVDE